MRIKTNFNFLKYRKTAFIGSATIIILGIIFFILRGGFNLGLDFQGGIKATISIESDENIKIDDIRSLLSADLPGIQVTERLTEGNVFEITYKTSAIKDTQKLSNRVEEKTKETTDEGASEESEKVGVSEGMDMLRQLNITGIINEQVMPVLRDRYGEGVIVRYIGDGDSKADYIKEIVEANVAKVDGLGLSLQEQKDNKYVFKPSELPSDYSLDSFVSVLGQTDLGDNGLYEITQVVEPIQVDSFEPTVGQDIQSVAWAVAGLIIVLTLAYLALRFQLKFGVAAVLAVVHDSLVILSILVITGFEVGIQTVTAVLTIIGYSLNDTIVVFDRIRENSENIKKDEYTFVINRSINEVLGRTVITSVTTLLAVGSLLIFGGPAIFELAFSITIGILVGTYSSIFIASPVLIIWENFLHEFQEMKKKETKEHYLGVLRHARNRWSILIIIGVIFSIIAYLVLLPGQGAVPVVIGVPALILLVLGLVLYLQVMKKKSWAKGLLALLKVVVLLAAIGMFVLFLMSSGGAVGAIVLMVIGMIFMIAASVLGLSALITNKDVSEGLANS